MVIETTTSTEGLASRSRGHADTDGQKSSPHARLTRTLGGTDMAYCEECGRTFRTPPMGDCPCGGPIAYDHDQDDDDEP